MTLIGFKTFFHFKNSDYKKYSVFELYAKMCEKRQKHGFTRNALTSNFLFKFLYDNSNTCNRNVLKLRVCVFREITPQGAELWGRAGPIHPDMGSKCENKLFLFYGLCV